MYGGTSHQAALIVIEDSWGYVFGGFIGQQMMERHRFYGTGESFVFSLRPHAVKYRWSGRNEYFCLSDGLRLAMGAGTDASGGFAFSLDEDLDAGISNESDTFNNKCWHR